MTDTDLLPAATASQARRAAMRIVRRLSDRDLVTEAALAAATTVGRPVWTANAALYGGAAGNALAFAYAARACPDSADRWWAETHRWLRQAADSTHESPLYRAGLSLGTAGFALAVAGCNRDGRYTRTLQRLHTRLAEQLAVAAGPGRVLVVHDYDVMSGLAGIVSHASRQPPRTGAQPVITHGIERLVARCTPRWASWRIAPENYGRPGERDLHPFGYVDLGLAHGLPGPLAALSHAWIAGYRAAGQREAIRTLADQLVQASRDTGEGRAWPRVVPFDAAGAVALHGGQLTDPAYCYGTPGVASALLDAADALGDGTLRAVATEGFEAVLRRLAQRPARSSSGLCHGVAGLVLICRKFAVHTGSPAARVALVNLVDDLLGRCDPGHPLLVRDYKPQRAGEPGSPLADSPEGAWIDSPGLLEGAAGVALVLLSVAGRVPPRWAYSLLVH